MDNLTHTAVGLFLSRAGLNRLTPHATAILLLAANAPDVDVVTAAWGSLNYLHYHRHLTHSLIGMPVMASLPVLLVWALSRKPIRLVGAFLAALIAVGSHLLLDWTNVYGVRLLLPFSSEWLRLDWTGVVDLWIWAALLLGIAGPFLSRLVNSEISYGSRRRVAHGRTSAILTLLFVLFYDGARGVLHRQAVATLESRIYRGETPERTIAVPGLNPLRWRGVVDTPEFYAVEDVDLTGQFDPARGQIIEKAAADPPLEAARRDPRFQQFLAFSQFPLWRIMRIAEPENAKRVEVFDMRFGTLSQPGFLMQGLVDAQNRVVEASFRFGVPAPR